MPDNTPSAGFYIPPSPPSSTYIPDSGMPKLDEVQPIDPKILGPTGSEYAQSISSGESITDLINDVQNIQAKGLAMLDSKGSVPNSPSPGGFNPDAAFEDLSRKLNPETASLKAAAPSVTIGKESDYNRYKDSKNFQTFGYTPNMGFGQEYKYGNAMTWGDTIGTALAGGSHLAWDTFVEGWTGWGRMTEALFTWDSSKLMGSPEEREKMARKQEEIMNKYAIYDTAESKDSIWNRQMFGNMLEQSGFAVGAGLQFAMEEYLTARIGKIFEGAAAGLLVARTGETLNRTRELAGLGEKTTFFGRTAEGVKNLFRPRNVETAGDLINGTRQVADVITRSEKVTSALASGLKALTPGYSTVKQLIKMNKAGAGFAQLAYTGLGGIKRGLSEFNMARSESIFEAASTYTQLKDRLTEDFVQKNGRMPDADELERIKEQSENASHDNFWVNMGVISVANRIQFDNMFKQFSKTRSLLGSEMAQLEGKAFQVTGKLTGKVTGDVAGSQGAKLYKVGLLGRMGAIPDIAKKFGGKTAAWEAAKGAPGLLKFEFAEGMQELIQTASDKGLEDYYSDLYHGKKGYSGTKFNRIVDSMQNPFTDTEGMKTFLMGALTGRLIAPMTFGFTKISEGVKDRRSIKQAQQAYEGVIKTQVEQYTKENGRAPEGQDLLKIQEFAKKTTEYKSLKQHVDESILAMNALYQDPTWLKKEALANIKVQDKAAATMDEAAANHDRYTFNNAKDSALAKAVAASIKLNLYDSLRDMLKEHGADMSDEEFQQAFGIDANKENKANAKKLTDNVVKQIEEYYDTFKKLKDEYGDRIMPELYKNNKPEDYKKAQLQKAVLDDVIEMLATNSYKAKQTIIRGSGLQTEMGQNPAIGGSTIQILTTLGSDEGLARHVRILQRELTEMMMSEVPSTPEQKELYKSKIEELKHIQDWLENRGELLNEAMVDKSYAAFAGLVNVFNKRSQNYQVFSKKDIEDNFIKFMDYIKLNKDGKKYIDAMNLLADPKNMMLVKEAYLNAAFEHRNKALEEQRREIEQATGVDIPRHEVIKEEDGTFTIKSPDGTIIEKGIVTEEEANAKAAELDAKLKEALEKEEKEQKEKEESEEVLSDIEAKKAEIEKARNKELAEKRPGSLALDEDGNLIEAASGATTSTDISGAFSGGINQTYQQIFDALEKGTNIITGLKSPEVDKLKPLFDKGLIKSKIDVYHRLNEPEINEKYDKLIEELEKASVVDKITLDQVLDLLKNAKDKAELEKIINDIVAIDEKGELGFESNDAAYDAIEKAYNERLEELEKLAGGGTKTVSSNDPTFATPYYEALDNIAKILNKPGVTIAEARAAFETLRPILGKLDAAEKAEFAKKHNLEREAVMQRIKAEIASKDIDGAKALITKSLASDDVSLNDSFQSLYQMLNLQLTPELKEQAIEHFEKEYIKAIDRKVNKLLSNLNTSTSSEALTQLINDSLKFKGSVQKVVENLKRKSEELRLLRQGESLSVDSDPKFTNSTHRSIISKNDGNASFGQTQAIENCITSGILSQNDLDSEDESSRHGASKLINLAVARISTLEVNKAASQHFRKEASELKKMLLKYVTDTLVGMNMIDTNGDTYKYTKEMAEEDVSDVIATAKTKAELLEAFGIPETRELSNEEFKTISTYRSAVTNLIKDSAILELLSKIENHQQELITSGKEATSIEIIPLSIIEELKDDYIKTSVDDFYGDLIETFEKLREVGNKTEAYKLVKELYKTHFNVSSDGLDILKTILANGLQADNLLKSDSDNSTKLTEEEMVKVLNEGTTQSLNKEQINQIERYAKEEKLPEYKRRFQTAVGYTNDSPFYTFDKTITPTTNRLPFNSLRPKSAADQRTAEDLSNYLMPDENGMVDTKLALTYILYSEHSTPSEKELARKLLEVVGEEDKIKIDNNIPAAGEYYPDTNEISINLEATGYKKDAASAPIEAVILHELIHAMIEKAISDPNNEYTKGIKAVMEAVRTRDGAGTFYAFQDSLTPDEQLREFVTEAFTNPAFQYLLATTPYKNTRTTLWDKFIEAVAAMLGAFGIDIRETALSETLSLTDQLINKEAVTKGDAFPSEKVMEEIKKADTKEDIDKIRQDLEANKDKFTPDMYNALDAALKGKMKSINARNMSDAVKGMETIKIGKTTYYFKGDSKAFRVFKKGRTKVTEVKDASVLAKIKDILDKRNVTDEEEIIPTSTGKVVILTDLKNKDFVDDPSTLDFSTVQPGETITAVEPNGLRSKGNDGKTINGKYVETEEFKKFYHKVRNIINILSGTDPSELDKFYVTLDKDVAGFRWDGSAETQGWKNATKGVVGYISDAEGNPIVFNKEGKAIGKADRNDPASSRFNTGENQIVYFNTYTETSDERSLARIDPKSLAEIFAARKAVMEGRPQIGRLQKVTPGQMVLGTMVKPSGKSQMNTARDKELAEQMKQKNVAIMLVNSILNLIVKDDKGGLNRQGLFTPSSRSIKVVNAEGKPYDLFDHLIELMKTYHQMSIDGNPNIGDVQKELTTFCRNMWLTGDRYSLKIPGNFLSIWARPNKESPQKQFNIFTIKDGLITINESNLKAMKNHINDMKINVSKVWLEGTVPFKFPYITEENGKKVINFEDKNYKDFLIDEIGLLTYASDIPEADKVRRYNSNVHFLKPTDLKPKPPTITTKQQDIVDDSNSTLNNVKDAVSDSEGSSSKNIPDPTKKRSYKAPSYEQTFKETYEKTCK